MADALAPPDVATWLATLAAQGVALWLEGDRVRFRAPVGALGPDARALLAARRAEILAHLRAEAARRELLAPMSFSQQSLWFLHQQAARSTAYHIAISARVLGPVDVAALDHAVRAIVDRHASLRTTYALVGGAPVQRVAGAGVVTLARHDATRLDEDALRAAVEADHRRPFDLEREPPLRASLYSSAPERHVLLLTVHHIAADGWSLLILFSELTRLHGEATGGPPAGLARPALEYTDYAAWQAQMLGGPEGERLWAYWRDKLAPPRARLELPSDRPRPTTQTFRGAAHPFAVPAETTTRLKELARQEGTTPFVVLLASLHVFLYRLTGTEDVIVGSPTFGRGKGELMDVVGDFVNAVPLRARLGAALTFRELVVELRGTVREALEAQEYPLPLLVRRLQPERDSAHSPLFDVFFTLMQRSERFRDLEGLVADRGAEGVVEVGGLRLAAYPIHSQEGQFDLTLQMVETAGTIAATFKYSTDLFEPATIAGFARDYLALVDAVVAEPASRLGELPAPARPDGARPEPAAAILERLRGRDIRLTLDGDRLRVNAPRGAVDEALKATIAARRDDLVAELRGAGGGSAGGRRAAIRPIAREGHLPVSSAQQRLWFLDRMEPGRTQYNLGLGVRFRGPLDVGLLRRALDELVARQESLRTRIGERDGAPALEILPPAGAALEVIDLGHLPGPAREAEARHRADLRLAVPFDLARGPLVGFQLVRLAPDDHLLTFALHHVIGDGWSLLIAVRELCALYDAGAAGRPSALPALPVQVVDYAAWEQAQLHAGALGRHLAYWKRQLAGAPGHLELPTDRPRPAAQSFRGRRLRRELAPALLDGLKRVAREHDATLYMILLAAWDVLLHRCSGQDELVVGSPVASRDAVELEGLIGCFVNNVALRADLSGNPTFVDLLAQVRRTTLEAFEHRALPFDVLVDSLRPERLASHAPVFQVLFTLHSFPTEFAAPGGLQAELVAPDPVTSRYDLSLELAESGARLMAGYEYATDLFDEASIARLHDHLARLLEGIVADPRRRVRELPLLTPEDERRLLEEGQGAVLEHDRRRCLHHLLEASARATPDAVAVVAGATTLRYRELDEQANRLAHLLATRGVAPGALVAVCLDRDAAMPVALAAILKAGAAYVPLDPSHPAERLRDCLRDAGVACAVTLARFAALLDGAGAPRVILDDAEVQAELATLPATPPAVAVGPEDRAYVIYTSGSTGRPKGVVVEHRNVVAFLEAMRREPGLGARDVLLAVTTLAFDIAGLELWLPATVGARVVIAARGDVLDGDRLAALLEEHGVTVLQATPATWRLLLEAGWPGKPDLVALCGGEALPRDLAAALRPRVRELWNLYGPTETTIWSTVSRVDGPVVTIGHPIAGTRAYVLEPSGQPAPVGVAGELCLGGEGVARGYHDRPELTAEKFVTLTLPGGRVERVYRTGDLARRRGDGQLEFLGRRDQQVKVRGYRIELGEIEAVLATHPGVKECVVAVREDAPGDQRLVGYVVVTPGLTFAPDDARATLRARLPEYMIPGVFLTLPTLPLTPNGKLDRKALPAPDAGAPRAPQVLAAADALLTPPQRRVAGVWREVLRVDHVGLHDNFFDLGGHSLLLVKLHAALRRDFDTDLALVELFQFTTVAGQADRLSAAAAAGDALRRARERAARQTDG